MIFNKRDSIIVLFQAAGLIKNLVRFDNKYQKKKSNKTSSVLKCQHLFSLH